MHGVDGGVDGGKRSPTQANILGETSKFELAHRKIRIGGIGLISTKWLAASRAVICRVVAVSLQSASAGRWQVDPRLARSRNERLCAPSAPATPALPHQNIG